MSDIARTDRNGIVVKIDGVDGCGKSTLVRDLTALFSRCVRVVATEEFRSSHDQPFRVDCGSVSRLMYEVALDPRLAFDDIERQLAMTIAARRHNRIVLPMLKAQYDLVICDRSFLTNYAAGVELGPTYARFVNWALAMDSIYDVIFWVDSPPTPAFARRTGTAVGRGILDCDLVEQKGLQHQMRQAAAFRKHCRDDIRAIRIDGDRPYATVCHDIAIRIENLLNASGYKIRIGDERT